MASQTLEATPLTLENETAVATSPLLIAGNLGLSSFNEASSTSLVISEQTNAPTEEVLLVENEQVPEPVSEDATAAPTVVATEYLPVADEPTASSAITAEEETQEETEFAQDTTDVSEELMPAEPASAPSPITTEPELQVESVTLSEAPSLEAEEQLPAIAPPIRPPLETGFSQFEFGLAEPLLATDPTYELLESEEADEVGVAAMMVPAFYGVADVGYALGGGSRLGYCLQIPDELTQKLPGEAFFEPDALIIAHLAAHQPTAPTRTSIDIISQFLRNKPRLKTPTALLPLADEQADLSVKSTRAEPDLASESLALIMVRQGKRDRAIEIYERLMVRQPEKMAYFADQIQKLKLSE
jgi:hypothetical protein